MAQKLPCPLCSIIPKSIYHIMFHCKFTNQMWLQIERLLQKIHPSSVTDQEKAFGIIQKKQTSGILLRNWLTYFMRYFIATEERIAHHSSQKTDFEQIKHKFNAQIKCEISKTIWNYKHENKLEIIHKIITHKEALCKRQEDGQYEIKKVFS